MSYSAAYVWAKILGHLEKTLPLQVITWFDDTEVLELTEEQLVLFTPTEFRKDMILKRCKGYICDAMKDLFDKEVSLEVLYEKELQEYKQKYKHDAEGYLKIVGNRLCIEIIHKNSNTAGDNTCNYCKDRKQPHGLANG